MILLGLTGSMAMGKSTTAAMFAAAGAAVYDADAAVHALYRAGGPAGPPLAKVFPDAVTSDGAVRRDVLRTRLATDPTALARLEAVVFPLLAAQRREFLAAAAAGGHRLAVLDIPLLYETGAEATVDAVVVVTASAEVQRARAMARPGMDEAAFAVLSARQTSDLEKRRRADFLVFTDQGLDRATEQVRRIVGAVLAPGWVGPHPKVLAKPADNSDIMHAEPGGRG